jgi:hypothetical protein
MANDEHKQFSHNEGTIYFEKSTTSLRFAFLQLTEFFEADEVSSMLDYIEKLNEVEIT